ncbi:MAG: ABC transporter substrate-binding protein [Stellaceae bacterium]
MPLRLPALRIAALLLATLIAAHAWAAEFIDSAGRRVALPNYINRVMAANAPAAVLIFALTPQKLVGWCEPLSRAQRAYLPAKYGRLPAVGCLYGPYPSATAATVARLHPDLVIASGEITPQAVAFADYIQQQTRIPYILIDGSIQRTPAMLTEIGTILGAGDHRLEVASYAFHAIQGLRGQLLIQSPVGRPLVYYGRGPDGLEAGGAGSLAMANIDQAGVINVAARLGPGTPRRVTRAQVFAWNPDIVIAQQRSFYNELLHDPGWRGLAAVRKKEVYLAPADPFGWIDDPAGVNRMVGLYWLSSLFYPDAYQQDLRSTVREFYQTFYGVQLSDRAVEALVRPAESRKSANARGPNVPIYGAEPPPLPELGPNPAPGAAPPLPPATPPGRGSLRSAPNAPPAQHY